jgi:predicted permease
MLHDVRYAARLLWKDRMYTATVVLTLALCIGANIAIFAVVDAVLLRPLPVPEADRLVIVYNSYPRAGAVYGSTAVPDYFDRRRETTVFEEQALYSERGVTLGTEGAAEHVPEMRVTPSFFALTRAAPLLGRAFTEAEGEPGGARKVVLTHGFWQQQFGGDPAIVGRDLRLDGEPHTVVGVLPPAFRFLSADVQLYRPLAFSAEDKADDRRHSNNWNMVARLHPGATTAQAQAQIDALNARNLERFPHFREILVNAGFHSVVKGLQDHLVDSVRGTLYLLWAGVAFLLVIGCVNVTNLVLVRSAGRTKELAMRHTLGARFGDIARQVIVETTILTLVAGVLGLVIGSWALGLLGTVALEQIPRASEIGLTARTLGFTIALALGLGALIGALPLLGLRSMTLAQVVREEGRSGTAGPRTRAVRRALVTAQVALAFMLLAGAGLLVASFERVMAVDAGFEPDSVLTGTVSPPGTRYREDSDLRRFATTVLDRVRTLPGVTHAALATAIPFGDDFSANGIFAEGYAFEPGESIVAPHAFVVSPGYFEALRIRFVAGRDFSSSDTESSPRVAIVDERLARKFWPGQDPIGRRIFEPTDLETLGKVTEKTQFITVVGVVGTVALFGPGAAQQSVGAYYYPYAQSPRRRLTLLARAAGDAQRLGSAVGREIATLDPELPFYGVKTMNERLEAKVVNRRTPMVLAVFFGGVAVFLAAIGIYGVLAYQVAERRREIGIRLALGSEPRGIFLLVLREGLVLAGIGFALGLAGAAAIRGAMQAQLYGIGALDPRVLGATAGLLALVALLACTIPARRAARVNPLIALTDT